MSVLTQQTCGLAQTSAPATEPLTTAELKSHLRVDISTDDTLIAALGASARKYVEDSTRRQLVTATWTLTLDSFPKLGGDIVLPFPPLQSVTSITYLSAAGVSTVLPTSVYQVRATMTPGRVQLKHGQSWPSVYAQPGSVAIVFVAGYGADASVPETFKQAIRMLTAHWYENREATISGTIIADVPLAVESLLLAEQVPEFG